MMYSKHEQDIGKVVLVKTKTNVSFSPTLLLNWSSYNGTSK